MLKPEEEAVHPTRRLALSSGPEFEAQFPKRHFRLNDKHEVEACNVFDWSECFRKANRVVAATTVGDRDVSTAFAGLSAKCIFETAIFGPGEQILVAERYATWAEAEAGHARWVNTLESITGLVATAGPERIEWRAHPIGIR